jgi:hypothetical protein
MKRIVILTTFCCLCINLFAQAPQKMSYQGVVRNPSGELVTNHAVGMKISILQGSASGSVVFSEIYNPNPQTNANGLVTVEIGSGILATGTFSGIDWAGGPFYLKAGTDPSGGTNYSVTGVSQLMSVPYALYARDVQNNADADANPQNEIQHLQLSGNSLSLTQSSSPVDLSKYLDNTDNQTLTLSGSNLSISGGNTVSLTAVGDKWGSQTVATDATLSGNGSTAIPLQVADHGVTSIKIADGTIANADIGDNTVTVAQLPAGAAADKYLRGDGTWAIPATGSLTETDPTWSGAANETADIGRSGRVGIGTTTPGAKLHLFDNSEMNFPQLLLDENDADYARLMFKNSDATEKDWTIAGKSSSTDTDSRLNFYYSNGSSGSNMVTITGEGKVGIGAFNPGAELEVAGR